MESTVLDKIKVKIINLIKSEIQWTPKKDLIMAIASYLSENLLITYTQGMEIATASYNEITTVKA